MGREIVSVGDVMALIPFPTPEEPQIYDEIDWPLYELDALIQEQKAGRPFDALSLGTLIKAHAELCRQYAEKKAE